MEPTLYFVYVRCEPPKHCFGLSRPIGNEEDDENPPIYGWEYNSSNESPLLVFYDRGKNLGFPKPGDSIHATPRPFRESSLFLFFNFARCTPSKHSKQNTFPFSNSPQNTKQCVGITRIPVIDEPMVFQDLEKASATRNSVKLGSKTPILLDTRPDIPQVSTHIADENSPILTIDLILSPSMDKPLGFGVRVDNDKKLLEVAAVKRECDAFKIGLKQGMAIYILSLSLFFFLARVKCNSK